MNKKGFTLTGVILMGILIAITTVAGMDFYGAIYQQRGFVTNRFAAINLANAQIEDLMAMAYADAPLNLGNHTILTDPTTMLQQAGYTVAYRIQEVSNMQIFDDNGVLQGTITYKLITVTVTDPRNNSVPIQGYKTS